jgi:ribonuclease VapC
VIVLDSSAVVAIFKKEPELEAFQEKIRDANRVFLSAVSYLEISMVLAGSVFAGALEELDAFLREWKVEVLPFDEAQAKIARKAFMKYGKGLHPAGLNFGDCAAYALAASNGAPLLFKGDDFSKTDIVLAV